MGAVMKGIVIAAEFAAVNRAKIIKTMRGVVVLLSPVSILIHTTQ
jgi:hypothetical protein